MVSRQFIVAKWQKVSHLGNDGGAHHLLPGWKHEPHLEPEDGGEIPEHEHEGGDFRAKANLGAKANSDEKVWFDPDLPDHRLANEHLAITGESGSGKTMIMKTIMADLNEHGIPSLVLDFKDDYAEPKYAKTEKFVVYDPTRQPLPLNPLAPPIDPENGTVNTTFHSYQLAEIIGRIYSLGDLQSYSLRKAIQATYEDKGLTTGNFKPDDNQVWPSFDDVKEKLSGVKGNAELLGHMAPIFDFGFFSSPDPQSFAKIVESNTVIRLGQLPGNEVKNSVAEFFLMALYNHLIRMEQTHNLRKILVLDEAWRLVNSPFLEPLMREGRAFGLGVFVATQFPTDLPLAVSGSTATQVFLSQSAPQEVTEIEKIMLGTTNSPTADGLGSLIRSLPPLTAVMHNKQYMPYVEVECEAYFNRHNDMGTEKTAQNSGAPTYLCPRCSGATDDPGHYCTDCQRYQAMERPSNPSVEQRIDSAQGEPDFPWLKAATTWDDLNQHGLVAHDYLGHGENKKDDQCIGCQSIKNQHDEGKHNSILPDWINRAITDPGIRCWWCKNEGKKTADLIPFPPGEDGEESWMFPYSIQERFVESPRRTKSSSEVGSLEEEA